MPTPRRVHGTGLLWSADKPCPVRGCAMAIARPLPNRVRGSGDGVVTDAMMGMTRNWNSLGRRGAFHAPFARSQNPCSTRGNACPVLNMLCNALALTYLFDAPTLQFASRGLTSQAILRSDHALAACVPIVGCSKLTHVELVHGAPVPWIAVV